MVVELLDVDFSGDCGGDGGGGDWRTFFWVGRFLMDTVHLFVATVLERVKLLKHSC